MEELMKRREEKLDEIIIKKREQSESLRRKSEVKNQHIKERQVNEFSN